MKKRTKNTLFMLSSLDGKISTGVGKNRDTDKDLHELKIKGLQQYYKLEQETEVHSFNTGRVMEKIGINKKTKKMNGLDMVSFIISDNSHLKKQGVLNLTRDLNKLYLVTSNKKHIGFKLEKEINNLEIIYYKNKINFKDLFERLYEKFKIKKITIQSGGTVNSILLRNDLIDEVSFVYAPILIGGKDTPTLVDGESFKTFNQLKKIKILKLISIDKLKHSFLHLRYKIKND